MQSYDIRIISVSYRREDDSDTVIVDIFGKTKEGTVVLARRAHRPWFHVIEPTEECFDFLKNSPETYEIKECVLWYNRLKRKALQVITKHPWKVGGDDGIRNELERRFNATVASCDIPFQLRFVYDYDLPSCVRVTGEPISNPELKKKYSTKIIINANEFQELPPFDVPIKVLCFDIENSIKHKTIFCIGCALRDGKNPIVTEIFSGSEAQMITDWVEYIKKVDPDVLCGYNSDGYDLPFIMNRADLLGLKPWETAFGRDGSRAFQPGETNNWKCHGRVIADVWWAVKREVKPKREKLNFVAEKLLGEKKDDVDSSKMDEEWAKDKDRVMEYCKKDASLTLRVFEHEKVRTVQKAIDLANVSRLPFSEAYDARTSLHIDSFLIRECNRRNIAVPPTRRHGNEEEKIEGGHVELPTAGLYNMVLTLDVSSMYPSQIKKNNICFTTRDQEGTIVSPHDGNVRYLTADIKEGLLPYMMKKLGDDRKVAKKKKAEAKASGRKGDANYYDGLQNAIKVVMNGTYGVFASSFYRFTDRDIGATITSFARQALTEAVKKLKNEGVVVLYGDTDSTFIQSPHEGLLDTVRFGIDLAERYSEGGVNFEFEKVMDPWFTHGMKKRYFGHLLWPAIKALVETSSDEVRLWAPKNDAAIAEIEKIPGAKWMSKENYWSFPVDQVDAVKDIVHKFFSGEHDDDMLVRGYETRRTDSFDLQSEAMTIMFQKILDRDIPGAVEFAVDTVQKTVRGEVPYPKLVISRSVKEDGEYKQNPDRMVNVLVSRKLLLMGQEFTPGMKVSWIVTNADRTPQEAEPYIDGQLFEHIPDWAYYSNRLAKSLARITELWDWDTSALLSKSRQAQLFNDGVTKSTVKTKKRRGKKKFPSNGGNVSSSLGNFGVDIPKRAPPAILTQPQGEKVIYRADPIEWPSRWETTPGCCMLCGRLVVGPPLVQVYKPNSETAFLPAHVGCFEKKFPDVDIEDINAVQTTESKL